MTDAVFTSPVSFETTMAGLRHAKVAGAEKLTPEQLKNIEATAQDFEAMFISEMMKHMFEGVNTDPMFGGGQGEDMFRGMLVQEYGKKMASNGGIGISEQLQNAMIQMQLQQS